MGLNSFETNCKLRCFLQCSTGTRPAGSRTRFPRFLHPGDLGSLGETFPTPHAPENIFLYVFPLFSLFTLPNWYYLENKTIYLVFTLHNHKYTSNELLFLIFYFIFIILETPPRPPPNFPKIWGWSTCVLNVRLPAPTSHCPKTLGTLDLLPHFRSV